MLDRALQVRDERRTRRVEGLPADGSGQGRDEDPRRAAVPFHQREGRSAASRQGCHRSTAQAATGAGHADVGKEGGSLAPVLSIVKRAYVGRLQSQLLQRSTQTS